VGWKEGVFNPLPFFPSPLHLTLKGQIYEDGLESFAFHPFLSNRTVPFTSLGSMEGPFLEGVTFQSTPPRGPGVAYHPLAIEGVRVGVGWKEREGYSKRSVGKQSFPCPCFTGTPRRNLLDSSSPFFWSQSPHLGIFSSTTLPLRHFNLY
jgi:hypothetical protein